MSPRYLTIDHLGRIYKITDLFDMFGRDTSDPALASTCLVELPDEKNFKPLSTDDIPIYTMH
jgi:hypothetical protein